MGDDETRCRVRIIGRVQGVGFRWFAVTEAERLALRGWVRNAADGSVEIEAAGPEADIAEFRRRLERGPPAARVVRLDELEPDAGDLPRGFRVVR